ncbi:aminotransferase class I/II-fold pyridoxal phosphate-dependent enzyme [Sinomicrobium soli]|uniref:aminotransferase class I/II-fold pyridoxal phosphate-dependent enzyme n=1 Tax=Sinomicrobium sp. N-1-3-6 TaxID=2219864 RepID=UPI000DCB4580|nr:aminotransferase class I/II-fold pyridoxal phosphate-dependent enzyme [Sinomicrobium sp. N-1-3-6]RAV27691.1 pyridoxal phosphate-dependent aminotransferase family protein [Sinomicrobium sp. N-1-3-6]
MFTTDSSPGRLLFSEGKHYRYFGGTAYLGLTTLPRFRDILIRNIHRYGTGYAASRKANVSIGIYEKSEARFAALTGSGAALSVSSGFLAGQLALRAFEGDTHTFFSIKGTHPALSHPDTLVLESVEDLIAAVRAFTASYPDKTAVVLCDSVSPENNLYENDWYEQLPLEHTAFVADDSHGLGVLGTRGGGIFRKLQKTPFRELLVCGSAGKGFGIQAGVICTSSRIIRNLQEHPFFAGASPAAPAAMAAFAEALPLYDIQREKLRDNMKIFDRAVSGSGIVFNRIEGHPAYAHKLDTLTLHLVKKDILTTAFHYPDTTAPMVRRIVLSASHEEEDITVLCDALQSFR